MPYTEILNSVTIWLAHGARLIVLDDTISVPSSSSCNYLFFILILALLIFFAFFPLIGIIYAGFDAKKQMEKEMKR